MNILYIAKQRRAAELAASALPAVAPDVAVGWAANLDEGRRWVDEHRDVATIIVEVGSDVPGCEAFIHDVHASGVAAPVVAVSATGRGSELSALQAVAAEVVEKNPSFLHDLPGIVTRALDPTHPTSSRPLVVARPTDRQSALDAQLVDASTSLRTIEARLNDTVAAIEQVRRDHAAEATAWAELHEQRTSELAERVAEVAEVRHNLEQQLADQAVALQRVTDRAAEERQAAQALASRHAELEARLDEGDRARAALEQRGAELIASLEQSRDDRAADADAAAAVQRQLEGRLADADAALRYVEHRAAEAEAAAHQHALAQQADLESERSRAAASRLAFEQQLADAAATLEQSEARRASEGHEAAVRLHEYQQQAESRLAQAAAAIDTLHVTQAELTADLEGTRQRAAAERQMAADHAAERQAMFEGELAQEMATRKALERSLVDAQAAQARAANRHESDLQEAAVRLSTHQERADAKLLQAAAIIESLHVTQAELIADLDDSRQRAATERQTGVEQAAERQATFESDLAKEVATRTVTEQALAASIQQFADYQQQAEKRLAESGAAAATLKTMLADATAELRRFEQHHATVMSEATARHADYQKQTDERMAQASAMLNVLKGKLAERSEALTRAQQQAADQCQTAADEAAQLTSRLARSETDASAAAERAERSLMETVASMSQSAREREALLEERAVRTTQQLQKQLEGLVADVATNRRRFDHSPASLCRCGRDGTIERTNQALADLLGYSTPEELQRVGLASVFETGDELKWLVDRCLTSRSPESIETTWQKQDGNRILVGIRASATAQDSIDLTVEDITARRSLEEKLRRSQRMEAVARYASEVALTCDSVLGNVTQEAHRIATGSDGGVIRHQVEMMLEEVTRASALLRRLAIYGEEEKSAPALVDLHRVLRDLAPVLKRVAGNHIEFVLPKLSTPHNLDVEAERVERILVNIAAYGRERMQVGGRLTFELDSVVVDRTFVDKYPNVRPGSHVLLTVTEKKSGAAEPAPGGGNAGVDLGTLQALVSDSGGHLWATVEPTGDMVLKIHLPRRVLDAPEMRVPVRPQGVTRDIARPAGVSDRVA